MASRHVMGDDRAVLAQIRTLRETNNSRVSISATCLFYGETLFIQYTNNSGSPYFIRSCLSFSFCLFFFFSYFCFYRYFGPLSTLKNIYFDLLSTRKIIFTVCILFWNDICRVKHIIIYIQ